MFQRNNFQQTAINSANMDEIEIMQGNWRGLSNKISELPVFLRENDIDIVCLNEVKCRHNENLTDGYFAVTETTASKSHGSMILAEKGMAITEVKPEKSHRNERGNKVFEILKACFKVLVLGYLLVIALYNPAGRELSRSEIFETDMKNVFICGDFNAPHQKPNCTYKTENGKNTCKRIKL